MAKLIIGTTLSLDGFMADRHGDLSPIYADLNEFRQSDFLQEQVRTTGAVVMGRRAYDVAQGDLTGYEFQVPIFVVTHHPPAHGSKGENDKLKVYFVTDGIRAAIDQARGAAGNKNVLVIGGTDVSRQILENGLADEFSIGIAPVLLGKGLRFFDGPPYQALKLDPAGSMNAAGATFLRYRISRKDV